MGEATKTFLTVGTSHPDCGALGRYAARIVALLSSSGVEADEAAESTLDLFAGAIHSLFLARHHEYEDRTSRTPSAAAVKDLADDLSRGQLRNDGGWLAGYHFNSGLARLAAVYERSMKIAGAKRRKKERKEVVEDAAGNAYNGWKGNPWEHRNIDLVYHEVNNLKHRADGLLVRSVSYNVALLGVGEVLTLLEAWRDASVALNDATGTKRGDNRPNASADAKQESA